MDLKLPVHVLNSGLRKFGTAKIPEFENSGLRKFQNLKYQAEKTRTAGAVLVKWVG
jgi:hypothetical protein